MSALAVALAIAGQQLWHNWFDTLEKVPPIQKPAR